MTWSNSFVGLPFQEKGRGRDGCDCWGLCVLVFAAEHGIALPSFTEDYASLEEREEIASAFRAAGYDPWRPVPLREERAFDVGLFRRAAIAAHVGIVVEPGLILHAEDGHDSRVEAYRYGKWRTRLIGFYRHKDMA
jgi:cell wall-associated NlpC family hydrolase